MIGAVWRAEYYLRVAQQVPASFNVGGVLVRSSDKASRVGATWALPAVTDLRTLLDLGPFHYVVLAVPSEAASTCSTSSPPTSTC